MFNTAVELAIDLINDRFHPLARIAKDVSAGAVLLASINAIIAGYLLFFKRLRFSLETGLIKIQQSSWHITFICLILILAPRVFII